MWRNADDNSFALSIIWNIRDYGPNSFHKMLEHEFLWNYAHMYAHMSFFGIMHICIYICIYIYALDNSISEKAKPFRRTV